MTSPEVTPGSPPDLKIWVRHLTVDLARCDHPPTCVEARVGGGLHLLLHGDGPQPLHLHVTLAREARRDERPARVSEIRSVEPSPLSVLQEQWLATLRRALGRVEKKRDWGRFLRRACATASPPWSSTASVSATASSLPAAAPSAEARVTSGDSVLLRVTRRCQARCEFCNAQGVLHDLAVSRVSFERRVAQAAAAGHDSVTLTGGEPTLRRDLPDLVRLVRSAGIPRVDLQTNGVWLHRRERVAGLAEAGLTSIFLSLHSARPEIHDAMMGLRGSHRRALEAAVHCRDLGIAVCVNCVVATPNLTEPARLAELLHDRLGAGSLRLSFVSPPAVGPVLPGFTPRLSEAAPRMAEAIDLGGALGLDVRIPGLCGIPMCQLPDHRMHFDEFHDSGPPPLLVTRTYVPRCEACPMRARCSGFWRAYLERFGEGELGWPSR